MWFKYGLKVHKRVCHKSTARKSAGTPNGLAYLPNV